MPTRQKTVTIGKVNEQDAWRRIDCLKMKGSERVLAIAERMETWDKPLVKKVEIRMLEFAT